MTLIDWVFLGNVAAMLVYFGACALWARRMLPLSSMPWAFHPWRAADLEFQSVLFEAFHTRWTTRIAHLLIPVESLAWLALALAIHVGLAAAVLVLLLLQMTLVHERRVRLVLLAVWLGASAVAVLAVTSLGATDCRQLAEWVVVGGSAIRTLSHVTEPMPPYFFGNEPRFVGWGHVRFSWRWLVLLPLSPVFGFVSEFASGLPYRLLPVQVIQLIHSLGYRAPGLLGWDEARRMAAAVHARGWGEFPAVRDLIRESR
jgi:hypothetical protein